MQKMHFFFAMHNSKQCAALHGEEREEDMGQMCARHPLGSVASGTTVGTIMGTGSRGTTVANQCNKPLH